MPCGKKPLVKNWDRPKNLKNIQPSRYQSNEKSVKIHWLNVIKNLELFYKDDQFWETQYDTVRGLVGPLVFERLIKIFHLPKEKMEYEPKSETSTLDPSERFYLAHIAHIGGAGMSTTFSMSDYEPSLDLEAVVEESEEWTLSSDTDQDKKPTRTRSGHASRSMMVSQSMLAARSIMSRSSATKGLTRSISKFGRAQTSKIVTTRSRTLISYSSRDSSAFSEDDMLVQPDSMKHKKKYKLGPNPHYDMLYCNDSETDMIKWNSHYKQKQFAISASDEYNKKAELLTKQIAFNFYQWWISVGSRDYKSEIKRPEDIEALFQVWFDEHASRGLKLDPKILPCVLESIANYVGVPQSACPKVLKRQIAWDIQEETRPSHKMAFNTCLPLNLKHIPPKNNTKATWDCVKIPQDLKTMSCVWGDISHLTSTKSFYTWLTQHPRMPMPECLQQLGGPGDKKQLFVIPSDYVVRDTSKEEFSAQNLSIPVSEFALELKEVLSKLLND